jgi:hypothetical protein
VESREVAAKIGGFPDASPAMMGAMHDALPLNDMGRSVGVVVDEPT